jgi:hypothetical protein
VADFHRLPEHPGIRSDVLSRSALPRQRCHGNIFRDMNFIDGGSGGSQKPARLQSRFREGWPAEPKPAV